MEQVSQDKSLQASRRRKPMRASTTDDNEAYSDLDARIDPFISVAILRIPPGRNEAAEKSQHSASFFFVSILKAFFRISPLGL